MNSNRTWQLPLLAFSLGLAGCNKDAGSSNSAALIQGSLLTAETPLPSTLEDTGLFVDGSPLKPSAALHAYEVKVPLWSDGARKNRYIFLPPQSKLSYDLDGQTFQFPVGTTLVKTFFTESDPKLPIEARVITLKSDGKWKFGTYVFNDDGSATLNERPHKVTKGGVDYRIPSEKECQSCHTDKSLILGFSLKQLNFRNSKGETETVTLAKTLALADPLPTLTAVKALDDPSDEKLALNDRVRAYMAVNCATCHYPDGPDEKARTVDLRLEAVDTGLVSQGKMVPGDPDHSIMWQKVTADTERMPNISLRSDPLGLAILKQYIEQYPK